MVTEELTFGGVNAEVVRQKHSFVMRQAPAIIGINLFAASFLVAMQLYYDPALSAFAWFGAIAAITLLQLSGWVAFNKKQMPRSVSERMLQRSTLTSFLNGAVWGMAPFLIPLDGSAPSSLFLAAVMICMAAAVFSMLSPMPMLVAAFVVPCMTPIIISCLYYGDPAAAMLSVMGVALVIGMIRGARISADYFDNMYRYVDDAAIAQTRLGEALDCSGEAIAIFDRAGQLLKANGAFRTHFGDIASFSQLPADGPCYNERSGTWSIGRSNKTSDDGTIVIHADITDLKNAEQESLHARMAAEEANRAKTNFLAAVSHELRTPLNAVIGYSDLLRRQSLGALGAPEYKDYSEKISDGGLRLLKQVNDIINLTKFESSTHPLDSTRISAASVIELVIEISRRSTRDQRPIAVSIDDDAQFLFADENAVKMALEHVLRNALKYTSPVDEIGVNALIVEGGPCIQVRDAGEGIPLEYLAHVTEPFLQAKSAYSRKHEGLGLGLAVAQSIMRAHGGSLEIESVEGAGTFVDLRFPAERLVRNVELQQMRVGT